MTSIPLLLLYLTLVHVIDACTYLRKGNYTGPIEKEYFTATLRERASLITVDVTPKVRGTHVATVEVRTCAVSLPSLVEISYESKQIYVNRMEGLSDRGTLNFDITVHYIIKPEDRFLEEGIIGITDGDQKADPKQPIKND